MQEEAKVARKADSEEAVPAPVKGPFDWRVVLIVVYLFALMILSINWFSGLMMANITGLDDKGNKITSCSGNLGSGCSKNTNAAPANSSNDSATNSTTSPATPQNTNGAAPSGSAGNTNRPSNSNINSNRPASAATPTTSGSPGAVAPDPEAPVTSGNTNANSTTNANVSRPSEVPDYVVIKNPGLFGADWISLCAFCGDGCLSGDGFLFLVVLFAGMIGATIRSLSYLAWYVRKGKFSIGAVWYYLFQPFFGATLAVIFYVVLRGGFGSGTIGKNNLYSFAAVAFLSGLFTQNVLAKLKLIAESILVSTEKPKPPKQGDGAAAAGSKPSPGSTTTAADSSVVTGTAPRNIGEDEPPV
jgi:hypothetical protein